MNTLLWTVQILLAVLFLSGGAYKATSFDSIAAQMAPLSRGATRALGAFEVAGALLLVVPSAVGWMPHLTPLAALLLALESLALSVLYARHSLRPSAANPLVWSLVMALLAVFVAWGRYGGGPAA